MAEKLTADTVAVAIKAALESLKAPPPGPLRLYGTPADEVMECALSGPGNKLVIEITAVPAEAVDLFEHELSTRGRGNRGSSGASGDPQGDNPNDPTQDSVFVP